MRQRIQYRVVYVSGEATIIGVEASSINVGFVVAARVARQRGEISRIEFWQKARG